MNIFNKKNRTAIQSIEDAQWIAYAPIVFQVARVLRDNGILKIIESAGKNGLTIENIVEQGKVSMYGVRVLLESALGIGLVVISDSKYTLTKTGHYILNDKMTNVNMNFVQDVCYNGMFYLEDSIEKQKPEGLNVFGKWKTVYEALSQLPKNVQKSWFDFDHYYSDDAFPYVLPLVFKDKPKKILDIGGNTGKWSIQCVKFDPNVEVTIVDLPGQVDVAKNNVEKQGLSNRISFYEINLLDEEQKLPSGYDAIWMSQFLDCFSEHEITSILNRCYEAIDDKGIVYILEPFWDRQRFEAAAFALQQTSLYFTAIANGNSQMYHSEVFIKCILSANFEILEQVDQIGTCQSLLKCKKISRQLS